MAPPRRSDLHLHRAFDTVRFGAANILNLREGLPSVVEATRRAEAWIRQRQVEGATELLVITGRGKGSEGGVSPVREAMIRLIASLRRRGILERFEEHTAGSFSLRLASLQAMVDAPRRRRESRRAQPAVQPELAALTKATRAILHDVAARSLESLGVKETAPFVEAEMIRQLVALDAAIPHAPNRDALLRAALLQMLDRTP
jgi:hypothetical protein